MHLRVLKAASKYLQTGRQNKDLLCFNVPPHCSCPMPICLLVASQNNLFHEILKTNFLLPVPVTLVTSTTTTTTSAPPLIEDMSDETSSSSSTGTALMLPSSGSHGCNIDDQFYMDGMQVSSPSYFFFVELRVNCMEKVN